MFLSFFTRSITHIAAYLYPSYSTYKALDSPASALTTRELERWLEYWAVLGSFLGLESLVGWWAIGWWMPFYDELKLAAVLWMVAPQAEGSTLIYNSYISPFFTSHENDIDAVLGDLRSLATGWIQRGITYAWGLAREKLNLAAILPSAPPSVNQHQQQQRPSRPQSTYSDSLLPPSLQANRPPSPSQSQHQGHSVPASLYNQTDQPARAQAHTQAFQFASSLITTYAPSILSQAQAHFIPTSSHHIASTPNLSSSSSTATRSRPQPDLEPCASSSSIPVAQSGASSSEARLRRRAQLEAELAALASPPPNNPTPRSRNNSNSNSPRTSSDESLLGRSTWAEIERDVDVPPSAGGGEAGGVGGSPPKGASWLRGWGGSPRGGTAAAGGYGRVSGGEKED